LQREQLWQIKPYGCIGKLRFLQLTFAEDPRYQQALARLKEPGSKATFLDLGCCVGQVLRQLAFDGADSSRLFGSDLEPRFMEMGYELFRDRETLKSTFVAADILRDDGGIRTPGSACSGAGSWYDGGRKRSARPPEDDDPLSLLDGKVSIVHAASLFHLFTWDQQVRAARRIVRLLNPTDPRVFIFGRQVGCLDPGSQKGPRGEGRYLHNAESWQRLWDEVGILTHTKWRTQVDVIPESCEKTPSQVWGSDEIDNLTRTRFYVYKVY
jgi:SAM-dependent methyltransferase